MYYNCAYYKIYSYLNDLIQETGDTEASAGVFVFIAVSYARSFSVRPDSYDSYWPVVIFINTYGSLFLLS